MKPYRILTVLLATALVITCGFPAYAVSENDISSEMEFAPEPASVSENRPAVLPGEAFMQKPVTVSENEPEKTRATDAKPGFSASIQHSFEGYIVKGCFTEFLPDTSFVQPQTSLDGETWQDCIGLEWNLSSLGSGNPDSLQALQNQICLYDRFEPLKSYLAGQLDRFYLRLRITRENGMSYETQAAVIERGEPQPIPEGITYYANFTPAMLTRETDSSGTYIYCGKYQLTVSAGASAADIAALLPDTLPLQIDLQNERKHFTNCTINCPVTWKSLPLPALAAGESAILRDAAEEIVIPEDTLLSTPMGSFTLPEPLGIETSRWMTDEVVLILNVISGGENPTGVLAINNNELKMAFNLKPTGATAIRVYTLADGCSDWIELHGLPLLDAINAQPATANSGYVDILRSDQEPYRSYLAAEAAGEKPTPFLVGVQIEGGVYDGCQLILACPDTYELPPDLVVGGSGGNEGNAGSGSRDDSTETGQRPNLPKSPTNKKKEPERTDVSSAPADSSGSQISSSENPTVIYGEPQISSPETPADTDANRQAGPMKVPSVTNAAGRPQDDTPENQAGINTKQQAAPADISPVTGAVEELQAESLEILTKSAENSASDAAIGPKALLLSAAVAIVSIYIAIVLAKTISGRKSSRL